MDELDRITKRLEREALFNKQRRETEKIVRRRRWNRETGFPNPFRKPTP